MCLIGQHLRVLANMQTPGLLPGCAELSFGGEFYTNSHRIFFFFNVEKNPRDSKAIDF